MTFFDIGTTTMHLVAAIVMVYGFVQMYSKDDKKIPRGLAYILFSIFLLLSELAYISSVMVSILSSKY